MAMQKADTKISGFTLIELSIVLVVIGLIVGGVLVGRDLITAAAVRAQISQIEKYQQAVNTFKGKYGYLPGDIPDPGASNFGFAPRGQYPGMGDGNGTLQGNCGNNNVCVCGFCVATGETSAFWVDLSTAHLIGPTFSQAQPSDYYRAFSATQARFFLPNADIGGGNSIYVFGSIYAMAYASGGDAQNFFGIFAVPTGQSWWVTSAPGLTVRQAYAIDTKTDDSLPQSGTITANYVNYGTGQFSTSWSAGGGGMGAGTGIYNAYPSTAATPGSPTTCYDNGNTGGGAQQYSLTQNNGSGVNCALSFKFQ